MAAVYSNKFIVEASTEQVCRIVFVDERLPVKEGFPRSSATVAEIVMTPSNILQLAELIKKLVK